MGFQIPAGGGEVRLGKQRPLQHGHQLPELGFRGALPAHGQIAHRGQQHRRKVHVAAAPQQPPGLVFVDQLEDAPAVIPLGDVFRQGGAVGALLHEAEDLLVLHV